MKRIAAIAFLTVLAHLLLMAAASATPGHDPDSHSIRASTGASTVVPIHEASCYVAQPAIAVRPTPPEPVAGQLLVPEFTAVNWLAPLPQPAPPHRPPSVIRALLQVYRI